MSESRDRLAAAVEDAIRALEGGNGVRIRSCLSLMIPDFIVLHDFLTFMGPRKSVIVLNPRTSSAVRCPNSHVSYLKLVQSMLKGL
jgi:hypothetical protein